MNRILLVEDDSANAHLMSRFLSMEGYRVTIAPTLAGAESLCALNLYDLLLVDLMLPDGNGTELLQRVRLVCNAPAIAISGYSEKEHIDAAREAGFAKYLTKPIVPAQLLAAMRAILPGSA